jgi:calcium/calmodulin-dependent protein kinase I
MEISSQSQPASSGHSQSVRFWPPSSQGSVVQESEGRESQYDATQTEDENAVHAMLDAPRPAVHQQVEVAYFARLISLCSDVPERQLMKAHSSPQTQHPERECVHILGRSARCDVRYKDPRISSVHCRVFCMFNHVSLAHEVFIEDASANGTFLQTNNTMTSGIQRLVKGVPRQLRTGDEVYLVNPAVGESPLEACLSRRSFNPLRATSFLVVVTAAGMAAPPVAHFRHITPAYARAHNPVQGQGQGQGQGQPIASDRNAMSVAMLEHEEEEEEEYLQNSQDYVKQYKAKAKHTAAVAENSCEVEACRWDGDGDCDPSGAFVTRERSGSGSGVGSGGESNAINRKLLGGRKNSTSDTATVQSMIQKKRVIHDYYDLSSNVIGTGTYASVREARRKADGSSWAVKIIRTRNLDRRNSELILREAEMLRSLRHSCITHLEDVFEDKDNVYLVMELCIGGDLFDRILGSELGRYSEPTARRCFKNILEGISYLHSHDVAHRDIKPENILLTSRSCDVSVKISDFGLAKRVDETSRLRTIVGTPVYYAPEIMLRLGSVAGLGEYSLDADMWSAGVLLYAMLLGRLPWQQDEFHDFERQAGLGQPVRRAVRFEGLPAISAPAMDLIQRLLVEQPHLRLTAKQALAHPWIDDASVPASASSLLAESAASHQITAAAAVTAAATAKSSQQMDCSLTMDTTAHHAAKPSNRQSISTDSLTHTHTHTRAHATAAGSRGAAKKMIVVGTASGSGSGKGRGKPASEARGKPRTSKLSQAKATSHKASARPVGKRHLSQESQKAAAGKHALVESPSGDGALGIPPKAQRRRTAAAAAIATATVRLS